MLEYRDRIRSAKLKPTAEMALSIACGLVLAEEARRVEGAADAEDAATLRAVQSVIEAQQAAMVAVMAATSTVAVTASS